MNNLDYREEIRQLLKEYEADETMPLEEVLDKIIAVTVPGKKGKVTFNKKDNSKGY